MQDQRAHERLNNLEGVVQQHIQSHAIFEKSLTENTALTQQISNNTDELVQLVRGAKGLRSFVVWVAPVVAAGLALWAWIKGP